MHTLRHCFDRASVSDRERRLLSLSEYGPEPLRRAQDADQAYMQELAAQRDLLKSGDATPRLKRFADNDYQRQTNEARSRMAGGSPARPIRSIQDGQFQIAILSARAEGKHVRDNYIYTSSQEKAWHDWMDGKGPMPRNGGYPSAFRSRDFVPVQPQHASVEHSANIAERARREVVQNAMLDRWRTAENTRREVRLGLYNNAAQGGGGDSYWGRLLQKFDVEMNTIRDQKPSLIHGLQTDKEFDAWIAEHNNYLTAVERTIAEWQSVLLQPVCTVNVLNEAEMGELLKHYDRTQVLFANYAQSRFLAEEMLNSSVSIEEKRVLVLKAVADLNAFGSHLYKYYAGQKVMPEQIKAYTDGVGKFLVGNGKLTKGDIVTITAITADEQGIRDLLAIRSNLLEKFDAEAAASGNRQIADLEATSSAMHREQEYLRRTNVTDDDRSAHLKECVPSIENDLIAEYKKRTDAAVDDIATNPDAALDAANREYVHLQTYDAMNPRNVELFHRANANPGIIQRALQAKHMMFVRESAATIEVAKTPEQLRAILQNVRAEGRFLWRHRGEMTPAMESRANNCVDMQGTVVLGLAKVLFANAGDDVVKTSDVIVQMAAEGIHLSKNEVNTPATYVLRGMLEQKAIALRGPVNERIIALSKSKTREPAELNALLADVVAERRALGSLGIGTDRIENLDGQFALYTEMTNKTDAAVDTELTPKKKGDITAIDSFKKAHGMLTTEEAMIKKTFAGSPEFIAERLAKIKERKDKLFPMVGAAAKVAVDQLDPKTATREDVTKASGLVDFEFQAKGGMAMSDPKELVRFDLMRTKIAEADAAVKSREQTAAKVAEEQKAKELADQREAEAKAAKEKAAKEKAKADKIVAEKKAKEQEEKAEDEQIMKNADKVLELAEQPIDEMDAANRVIKLDQRIDTLLKIDDALVKWGEKFHKEDKSEYVSRIDQWSTKRYELDTSLRADLEKTLVKIGDADSLRRASSLFEVRYMQFILDELSVGRESTKCEPKRIQLLKDLSDGPESLLGKVITCSTINKRVAQRLKEFETKLRGSYELRH